jgi:hypothetical protein
MSSSGENIVVRTRWHAALYSALAKHDFQMPYSHPYEFSYGTENANSEQKI